MKKKYLQLYLQEKLFILMFFENQYKLKMNIVLNEKI